jgi:DNA-binding beta-propeller fold protein YncE
MKYMDLTASITIFLLFSMAMLLQSCAVTTGVETMQDSAQGLAWPPPPSVARIAYVGSLAQPDDLHISQGFFGMLRTLAIGDEDNSMMLPMAVVKSGLDQLFVADPGKKAVHRFDLKRGKYQLIKIENDRDFASPVGMTVDQEGNVFIADSELAKVFVLPVNTDYAIPLALDEDLVRPTGLILDQETGWLYVVDTGIHAVYVFQSDASLVKKFGHRGSGDGEFNFPTYIWQNREKKIFVTDSLNFRVQIFNQYGNYLTQFGHPGNGTGDLARPKGLAGDSHGHIYVTDSLFHNVQVFDESGALLTNFGEQGSGPGQFCLPVGITITSDDMIYVADSYNKRVQIFRYTGAEQ